MRALLSSALLFAATAHLRDEPASGGRRLTWLYGSQPMWGECLAPLGEGGCSPGGGFKCSDRISPGPEDADVQIVIGGLPNSTADAPLHLQFWAPRKSPTDYKPLETLANCSIYKDMIDAYPHFDAGDFNGGNVLVSETGEATIRVRRPATYKVLWLMWWVLEEEIPVPHIHLRLCYGDNYLQSPAHAVFFSWDVTWLASIDRPHLELRSVGPYADRSASPPFNTSAPAYVQVVGGTVPPTTKSTTIAPTSTIDVSTSPIPAPSPVPTPGLIDTAKDALDLDALEFSPVYRCLLEDAFFDHFSSSCAEECPSEAVVQHGQCVHPESDDELAELSITWKLEIDCGEFCWHDKKLVALHNVRLSAADLLNVPFQELTVEMGFMSSSASRRLANVRVAYLTVTVISNRVAEEAATAELSGFVRSIAFISQLLGLDVLKAEVVPRPDGELLDKPVVKMDPDNDPYQPAYLAIEPGPAGGGSSVLSFLPTSAIIGIAAGVLVILSAVVGSLVWRRRRAQRAANEANIQAKVNEKVADPEESKGNAPASEEQA